MAWNFNGSTGYIGAAAAPVTAAPLTMACWFRKAGVASSAKELIGISDAQGGDYFILSAGDGASAVVYAAPYDGAAWDIVAASATFTTDEWNHAAAVFVSDAQRHAFLNGGNKGSGTTSVSPSGLNTTAIGRVVISGATGLFEGDIAEVAIWNAALTDEEIAVLAKGFSPLCLWHRLPNLVLYQDLIRPLDRPGIGPAMTAMGGTSVAAHPRMIYPASHPLSGLHQMLFAVPYRLAAAAAHAGRVSRGWAALAGAEQGTTYPIGEVSS